MPIDFDKLARVNGLDGKFLQLYAQGIPLMDCYRVAFEKTAPENVKDVQPWIDEWSREARSMLLHCKQVYPDVVKGIQAQRMEMMDELTDDGILDLLASHEKHEKSDGIKHARALRGRDAPTKVQLTNPDLVKGDVTADDPRQGIGEKLMKIFGKGA